MSDFIPAERLFPAWLNARAELEPLVPDRPTFTRSRTDPYKIEVDDAWAILMLSRAPDEFSFASLALRIELLVSINSAALQTCRLEQFLGCTITAETFARINASVRSQDEWRQSVRLPSFKDLARDALGLQSILRPCHTIIQVKPHDTLQ